MRSCCFIKGYDAVTIADVLFKSEKTVHQWLQQFQERRIASLFPKTLNNQHAAKLNRKQKQELKAVLSQKPSIYGIPSDFWDVSTLKNISKRSLEWNMNQKIHTGSFLSSTTIHSICPTPLISIETKKPSKKE